MFPSSTQLKFWTFSGQSEITRLRKEANTKYRRNKASLCEPDAFLTENEEQVLTRHYEYVLKEFCGCFQPPMPSYVVGTAVSFFKRFYLHNSVMNYHPKHLVYTSVYLAAKVEEFNVSITQFVANMQGDKEEAADIILQQELLLMEHLHYHLTVHNPFRPLEGLLIDIKSRCDNIDNAEMLRKGAEEFVDRSLSTDVSLLFSPSQIALAGILSSASKININLDSYVTSTLLVTDEKDKLAKTIDHIKKIKFMVKNVPMMNRDEVKMILTKLDACVAPENNPESAEYERRLEDWEAEEKEEDYAHSKESTRGVGEDGDMADLLRV